MNPTDLERIVSPAEVACTAAVSQPKDALVRQRLYHALAPLVSPAFPGEDPESAHLHELFGQARVWADIVRQGLQASMPTDSATLWGWRSGFRHATCCRSSRTCSTS